MKNKSDVPYEVQEWMLDSLSHIMLHEIQNFILCAFEKEILEEAKERFKDGYGDYGSTMYTWTPEERWQNVVEELADAIVYLTSGPIPKQVQPINTVV